jgi:hypothetical protein
MVPTTKGVDSTVEHVLVDDPDASNWDALAAQTEAETLEFTGDSESLLSKHNN